MRSYDYKWDWKDYARLAAAVTFFLVVVWAIYWNIKHPCTKYRQYECEKSDCDAWMHDANDNVMCISWTHYKSTCEECTERKP